MSYQEAWEELKEWLLRSQEIVKEFKDDKSIENNRYFILRLNEKYKDDVGCFAPFFLNYLEFSLKRLPSSPVPQE